MITDPITTNNGAASVSYAKVQQAPTASLWTKSGSVLGNMYQLSIQHTTNLRVSKTNSKLLGDRHNLRLTLTQTNANGVDEETGSVSLTVIQPRSGTISQAELEQLLCTAVNLVAGSTVLTDPGANWDKFLNGES